jgi:hypothetical protein
VGCRTRKHRTSSASTITAGPRSFGLCRRILVVAATDRRDPGTNGRTGFSATIGASTLTLALLISSMNNVRA